MDNKIESLDGCLRIQGDMTVYSAAELQPALLAAITAGGADVQLDLSQVDEFDSAGLQLVLATLKHVGAGGAPRIAAASRAVREVLDLFYLTHLLGDPAAKAAS